MSECESEKTEETRTKSVSEIRTGERKKRAREIIKKSKIIN